jgi:hypothetical protein
LRVLRNEAQPSSKEELSWIELVGRRSGIDAPVKASSHPTTVMTIQDLQRKHANLLEESLILFEESANLFEERNSLFAERHNLRTNVATLQDNLSVASELCDKLKHDIALLKSEHADTQQHLKEALAERTKLAQEINTSTAETETLRADIDAAVEAAISKRVKAIESESEAVHAKNARLVEQIAALLRELKRFIPPKTKCPQCDGHAIYYDLSTYRSGSDYEPRASADVCGHCRGAGYVPNPDRQIINTVESNL